MNVLSQQLNKFLTPNFRPNTHLVSAMICTSTETLDTTPSIIHKYHIQNVLPIYAHAPINISSNSSTLASRVSMRCSRDTVVVVVTPVVVATVVVVGWLFVGCSVGADVGLVVGSFRFEEVNVVYILLEKSYVWSIRVKKYFNSHRCWLSSRLAIGPC